MCFESTSELKSRAELYYPLLLFLKNSKNMFKTPIKRFKEDLSNLANNKSYSEYISLIEEIKANSKGKLQFKYDFIVKMIELIKESCIYQHEVSKILTPFRSMSSLIRQSKKGLFNSDLKQGEQAKLVKFINMFARADFISKELLDVENTEILFVLDLLESQSQLIQEYKKSLQKGIDEYVKVNLKELEIFLTKYKNVQKEIKEFQKMAFSNFEKIKFNKDTINRMLKDIKRVVDKYKEYQSGIFRYQDLLSHFQKIRNLIVNVCRKEFGQDVEVICEFNLE